MKNRYEALLVLNSQGKKRACMTLSSVGIQFKKEGAEIEQVQKMDKRQFSYGRRSPRRRILRQLCLSRRSGLDYETAFQI